MVKKQRIERSRLLRVLTVSLTLAATHVAWAEEHEAFIPRLVNSSTIPANGDLNPYGVAFVPGDFPTGGTLSTGDVLVSNFNDSTNTQGTGTTIIKLAPGGTLAPPGSAVIFFTSKLPGLSTALGVLRAGFVIVGNVPTTKGNTLGKGALQVIDRHGKLLAIWTDPVLLDGPWDLALDDDGPKAHVFVSNVGNGTVSRLDVAISSGGVTLLKKTAIAHGYTHVPNMAALVLGPTGLAFDDRNDTLYVASTADNAVYRIANASSTTGSVNRGAVVFASSHLRGPLALRFAPNGHLLAANGDAVNADMAHPSEIVEFTRSGEFVGEYNVDASQGGAFGIDTVVLEDAPFNYAVVDDNTNSLSVYRLPRD
jgi:DNA-binding beta-propeller fold protein YncE